MMADVTEFVLGFLDSLGRDRPPGPRPEPGTAPAGRPPEGPGELRELLRVVRDATGRAHDTTGPGCYAYFPGGGLVSSAVAELLARVTNRYSGFASMAGELVALEESVLRWLCREFLLPDGARGLVTTGASAGTLAALVAARTTVLGGPGATGTLYVTRHTHHCVAKAAMLAGFAPEQVREVPVDAGLRMDARAAEALIEQDWAAGRRPFLLVGTAGATDTGTIDPLPQLADIAGRHGMWLHADAAYGGGFQLTGRGRALLAGVERADSIVLDAHKSLFLPYTTGVLLVRDGRALRLSHATAGGAYLRDLDREADELPDYADLGAELSREWRGLRLWFPLQLHGVAAFRAALDEKLDLAAVVDRELRRIPGLRVLPPDLTVHVFRVAGGDGGDGGPVGEDETNLRVLRAINASGRATLTSTRVNGRIWLRMCVLNHRTHREHVDDAVRIIRDAVRQVAGVR
ncbi:aminotransferase class V-fold PLP-dependent enzyme [Streptomyces sp. SB3404]|uniref:Aminotransferase class V-fold PLP-dependent enzyme n=2 Tax=Streptomyces boncukensis TaxID=2711219 RepID=A0A6G4WPX4_9ACTN|nr:aminotransferase class V-fold PLP-dependent enzyme [Streptomyces boncukensis]